MPDPLDRPAHGEITSLLTDWQRGDDAALHRLIPLVYNELRSLADRYLRHERANHTLQPTALAHEAYVRLLGQEATWENRAHFFGIAAELMRRILVDYARRRQAEKRGGAMETVQLDSSLDMGTCEREVGLLALDDALATLAQLDAQQSRIIELRFFTGLSIEETAQVLALSPSTVKREWRLARAWLVLQMTTS